MLSIYSRPEQIVKFDKHAIRRLLDQLQKEENAPVVRPLFMLSAHWCGMPSLERGEYAVCIMKAMTANCLNLLAYPDVALLFLAGIGSVLHIRPLKGLKWRHEVVLFFCAYTCIGIGGNYYALLLLLSGSVHWDFMIWAAPLVLSGLYKRVLAILAAGSVALLLYTLCFEPRTAAMGFLLTNALSWPFVFVAVWLSDLPDTYALFALSFLSEKHEPSKELAEFVVTAAILWRAFIQL